ncbi:MAG: hypothetical protein JRJ43_10715 [Deltaproteobacteria bacterium]|nr:hypothetical protein [Deltaproteobacteria bacterium]MBW1720011.1 hypothetical protein [Deltaproteobacteria bacterium]
MPLCSSQAEEQSVLQQESAEALFLQWVNEARANPWAEAERLGLNVTELRNEVDGSVASQWDEGLSPLEWNEQLALAAACHVQDMLDRGYYSHISPEGLGPEQRIPSAFYDPLFYGESLGGVAFIKVIPAEKAAHFIYDGLLRDAFCQGSEGAPLLDPLLRDIGLCLDGGVLFFEDSWYNVYILTCDLGRIHEPVSDGQEVLYGHLFKDLNSNGRYDLGEGIQGSLLTISGLPTVGFSPMLRVEDQIASGREGSYLFELMPGDYSLTVEQNGETVSEVDVRLVDVSTFAVRLDLVIADADILAQ